MEVPSTSTPKPRRTQMPSFSTPSKIPRMKDSTLTKTFTFAPVKLFSVSAVFSNMTSQPQAGYKFTFVHEGRQKQAVLDKAFLTGLEKDNVRITWEQATRELHLDCEVRVDVTQLKRKSFDEKWLVFGLYFYTILFSGDPSSIELAGIGPDSCHLDSNGGLVKSNVDILNGETLRSAFCTKIDLLENSPSVQEVMSSSFKETNLDTSLVDVEDSSDSSLIEAQFEKVLEENGLLENYNHLAKTFDQIYEVSLNNNQIVLNMTPPDKTVLNTTNSVESDLSPSSSLILDSQPSQDSEKEITVINGPALTSTPTEKYGDGDQSLTGFGLESARKLIPVKMDSGYYETFSSGSLLEISSESDESSNPAEKNLAKLPICAKGSVFRQLLFFSLEQIIYELASFI